MAKKKPYRFFLYLLARIAEFFVYVLPRPVALFLARRGGELAFRLVARQRRKILENLNRAFGDEKTEAEIQHIASRVMSHLAETMVDLIQLPKLSAQKLDEIVNLSEGLGILEDLRRKGRGVITLTAHLGNWELLAAGFAMKGLPMSVIARRLYYERYNHWIIAKRQSAGLKVLYQEESAKELLTCLRRNEIIGILPDQDIDRLPGIFVDFFGHPAYTTVAPVKLALKLRTPIAIGFLIREPQNRYRLVVGDILEVEADNTLEDAVREWTLKWTQCFEKFIRQYPEQWVWMHNRWRTQPQTAVESPVQEKKKAPIS